MYGIISNSDDTLMYVSKNIQVDELNMIINNIAVPLSQIKKIENKFYVEIDSIPENYPETVYVYKDGKFVVKEDESKPTYEEEIEERYRERLMKEVNENGYNA